MTSYNLLNGKHTSEHRELLEDVLRCEFEFDGIVMTDWVTSSDILSADAKYPAPEAYKVALAGNDLFMPGSQQEIDNLTAALKNGHITREELIKMPSGSAGWLWNSQALQFDRPFVCFRYWSGVTPYCFLNTF